MHDGDLNLIHFNKYNYTCYSCHEHQGGGGGAAVQIPLMFSTLKGYSFFTYPHVVPNL